MMVNPNFNSFLNVTTPTIRDCSSDDNGGFELVAGAPAIQVSGGGGVATVSEFQIDAEGAARRAIFNLKLPMKKRYDEVKRCEQRILEVTDRAGAKVELRIRQLYHDREEVTGYLVRRD